MTEKSDISGVGYVERRKKWAARLRVRGRTVHLGYYDTLKQATAARLAAEKKYGVKSG